MLTIGHIHRMLTIVNTEAMLPFAYTEPAGT